MGLGEGELYSWLGACCVGLGFKMFTSPLEILKALTKLMRSPRTPLPTNETGGACASGNPAPSWTIARGRILVGLLDLATNF